ncbi:Uncharacterized protein APZ42_021908 [Daphnia magna]|uniref:Uncharacterized protein n=1 Tax=Daphnia magna TaxID=35525 RepID=A0A162C9A5_9CRUS|nr:Uncharacterized protein APZ42_021908 [Daphnia magna]
MLKERASLLKTSQVRLKSVRDGLVARLCSRPSLLKVVLGLRTTPSQDFGVNLNCVCLDFGFSSRIPLMAKCVFVLPTPPSAYSPPPIFSHSNFLLRQYIGRFNQLLFTRFPALRSPPLAH